MIGSDAVDDRFCRAVVVTDPQVNPEKKIMNLLHLVADVFEIVVFLLGKARGSISEFIVSVNLPFGVRVMQLHDSFTYSRIEVLIGEEFESFVEPVE
jgi:hypothetical protein